MATSPYFSTSNQYIKYDIHVDEQSTSIANNTSTVRVYVIAWRTNTGYQTYGSGTCYCNINGTNYSQGIDSSQVISYESDTVLFDKTVTIPHNADGTKTIYVSAYINHSRFTSNSQGFNVTLTTIPKQANLVSAPNFYDVDNPTITYSNPAGNSVSSLQACISLTGSAADIPYRNISKTGTSYTFNLTQAERNTLLAACPNSNTLSVKFYVKSVVAGQTYYSILDRTMTVKNANPTISGASYSDTNSTTTAITNNNQQIIQGQSTVDFKFTSLAALKYATLTKIEITVNAVKVTSNLSGSSVSNKTVSFGTINASSNLSASITLTDSRGNKTTATINITMLAYSLPTAIISLRRKSNYYNETYLNVNADWSSLDNKNSLTIKYQYKETSGSSWSALTTIQDETTYTLSFDNSKSYDFKIIVTDRIGSTTYNTILQIGIPIIYFDRLLRSVGIGTIPSQTNELAIDRRLELKNTLQENLADFWTTVTTGNYRSAFLLFRNQNNNRVLQIGGDTTNGAGYITLFDANGNATSYIYTNSYGGGSIDVRDGSGNIKGNMFVGSAGDGTVNVFDSNSTNTINLSGQTGKVTCVSVQQTSSRKVKVNIKEMDPEEAYKILELIAVSFDFKDKERGTDKRGFIAEDVAEIIPQLVTPETEETPASLDYIEMIPYLQTVIKEQDKRIKYLEDKLEELTIKIDLLS